MIVQKVLCVLTNTDRIGSSDIGTGWTLRSVASAKDVFDKEGMEMDFVSPKGGLAPVDQHSVDHHCQEQVCSECLNNKQFMERTKNTMKPSDVKVSDYVAMYFPGGIGQLFDVAENEDLARLAATLYEQGGVIGTVGHGLCGLLNAKLNNGEYLLNGKEVTGFTKEEEDDTGAKPFVPISLEEEIRGRGAKFVHEGKWQNCFKISDRLVTAQNQKSSTQVASNLVRLCKMSQP